MIEEITDYLYTFNRQNYSIQEEKNIIIFHIQKSYHSSFSKYDMIIESFIIVLYIII